VLADIFQHMHLVHLYMRLVLITSSVAKNMQAAEIKYFSKVMPPLVCMPEHLWKDA
jgi:hypothetical protein